MENTMTPLEKHIRLIVGQSLAQKIKVFKDEVVDLQVENERLSDGLDELTNVVKMMSKQLVEIIPRDDNKK